MGATPRQRHRLVAASATVLGASALSAPAFSVFLAVLAQEYSFTVTELAFAVTLGSGGAALVSPLCGRWLDDARGHWVIPLAGLGMAVSLCLLPLALDLAPSIFTLWIVFGLARMLQEAG